MRVILGSGRSGTTWVLDALADANALRPVFEPLHPDLTGTIGRRYANRHLDRTVGAADLGDYLRRLDRAERSPLSARLWTDYRFRKDELWRDSAGRFAPLAPRYRLRTLTRNIRDYRAGTRRRPALIKCIRANLMTDWLGEALGARMLLLIRHPCAVLDSKLRLGRKWDPLPLLARYRDDERLGAVLREPYRRLLERVPSTAAAHALVWCLENAIPLELGLHPRCRLAFFEDLAGPDAPAAWSAAAAALGLEHVPEPRELERPSGQASVRWKTVEPSTDVHRGWRSRLPGRAVADTQAVLAAVGCTLYSVDDDAPSRAA